jgi:hypothetical protein
MIHQNFLELSFKFENHNHLYASDNIFRSKDSFPADKDSSSVSILSRNKIVIKFQLCNSVSIFAAEGGHAHDNCSNTNLLRRKNHHNILLKRKIGEFVG